MGRPKKSAADHIKAGTYREDRHGPPPTTDGVTAESRRLPKKPEDLGEVASAVWDELLPLLADRARESDAARLADLCRWRVRLSQCAEHLDEFEIGTVGFGRVMVSLGIIEDKVNNLSRQFGLTPESRAKLKPEVSAGPVAAKVPTRPRTKLDMKGPPK
jgi:phage terminase small subunit